jgi:hypothetical protein
MNFINNLRYRFNRNRVEKKLTLLCQHMLKLSNYYSRLNYGVSEIDSHKKTLVATDGWIQQSDSIFKHKPSGSTLEIKQSDDLREITKQIFIIELSSWLLFPSKDIRAMLERDGLLMIEDFFTQNRA